MYSLWQGGSCGSSCFGSLRDNGTGRRTDDQNYENAHALDDFPDEQMTRWEVKYEIDKTLKGR